MARTPTKGGTKASAIRAAIAEHPKKKTSEIVQLLTEKGIKVTPNHVYMIRARARGRKRKQRREAMAQFAQVNAIKNPVDAIVKVRKLADDLGGMKHLKQIVDLMMA